MDEEEISLRRVKFYGTHDLSTGWQLPRVIEIIEEFDGNQPPTETQDLLELFNVEQYLAKGILPQAYSERERAAAIAEIPQIRSAIARHFSGINESNFAAKVKNVDWQFLDDLLELLGRYKAFDRCSSKTALEALASVDVYIGEMLSHKRLVHAYDNELRDLLISTPSNAEIVIRKHLEGDSGDTTFIPPSLSADQSRDLIESYIDSVDANPNFVELVANAKQNSQIGMDAKLKLRAKRRHKELLEEVFKNNAGTKMGYSVGFSDSQDEPVSVSTEAEDGFSVHRTYSTRWLEQTLDPPSIFNNFMYLIEFSDDQALLTMPSYRNQIGTFEGLVGTKGKSDYVTGYSFARIDSLTLIGTLAYMQFLESKDVHIEKVIQWFFEEYIRDEFGAENFSFSPTDHNASYLSRVRHLFAEMESVTNQFSMFAEEGVLDRELLSIGSDQVRYKDIPSLLTRKYAYPDQDSPITAVLWLLFSDQSRINYIDENLKARNAVALLLDNEVAYTDFHHYQTSAIDFLIDNGVALNTGSRVEIANLELLRILISFHKKEAVSFHHLSIAGQQEVEGMEKRGWITFGSTLLTSAEGSYFNYFLNGVDYGNGPQLRNKYLHGTQANGATENEHASAYTKALRLLIAIVIKMNDDFSLRASAISSSSAPAEAA